MAKCSFTIKSLIIYLFPLNNKNIFKLML